MPADLKIVEFRQTPLTDVPGMMRRLADQIEAGEYGEVKSLYALMPRDSGYPSLFGWGDITGKNDPIIQLDLAKLWLLMNLVERE